MCVLTFLTGLPRPTKSKENLNFDKTKLELPLRSLLHTKVIQSYALEPRDTRGEGSLYQGVSSLCENKGYHEIAIVLAKPSIARHTV